MIINPLERFSKQDLANKGYKLAFLDVSLLDPVFLNSQSQYLKQKNIILVVNGLVIMELLKGLYGLKHQEYKKLAEKKILLANFLDEAKCLYLLPRDNILTYELLYMYKGYSVNAHDFFKIFCYSPLLTQVDSNKTSTSLLDGYPCDRLTKFRYKLLTQTSTFKEYLIYSLRNLKEVASILEEGKNENYKAIGLSQKILEGKDLRENHMKDIDKLLLEKLFLGHTEINSKQMSNLISKLSQKRNTYLSEAPLYSLEDIGYCINIQNHSSKEKKPGNDFMDSMHATSALSYCDYLLMNDNRAKTKWDTVINKFNLRVIIKNTLD